MLTKWHEYGARYERLFTCTCGLARGSMLIREVMPLLVGLHRQNTPGQDLSIATTTIFEASTFNSWSLLWGGGQGKEGRGRGGKKEGDRGRKRR